MSDTRNAEQVDQVDQGEAATIQAFIEQAQATQEPVLIGRGKYSLFATPEGGLHLAYRPEGSDEDGHFPIPPGLMRLAMAKDAGAGAFTQIRQLMGM